MWVWTQGLGKVLVLLRRLRSPPLDDGAAACGAVKLHGSQLPRQIVWCLGIDCRLSSCCRRRRVIQ